MRRRELLVGAGVAGVALSGCAPQQRGSLVQDLVRQVRDPRPEQRPPSRPIGESAFLNRAAFGTSLRDAARVAEVGKEGWLTEQLKAPVGDAEESLGLRWRLNSLDVYRTPAYELRDLPQKTALEQLARGALLRATYSQWQLRERLVDFWCNHLNIYARKVFTAPNRARGKAFIGVDSELMYLLATEINEVVRKNVLGSVRDIIAASMRSAAMLGYLDQQVSDKKHPNENYARELMELHTLGVDGGYSQKDVMEVARCLTGWTIEDGFLKRVGTVYFDSTRHDDGPKEVLGHKIAAGGGEQDAEMVLNLLCKHPSTARFLSRKLVRYFYGDGPAAHVLQGRVADVYQSTNGALGPMMRTLLLSPEMETPEPILKRPFDYVVTSLRATNALSDGGSNLQHHLTQMGQPLYEWPMPDGYPDRTAAWTGSLLARWNFSMALVAGSIGGTQIDSTAASALLGELPAYSGKIEERIALGLAAPGFQWR